MANRSRAGVLDCASPLALVRTTPEFGCPPKRQRADAVQNPSANSPVQQTRFNCLRTCLVLVFVQERDYGSTEPLDSQTDVGLRGGPETQAHFVVGLGAGGVFGVAQFAWDIEDIVLKRLGKEFGFRTGFQVARQPSPEIQAA